MLGAHLLRGGKDALGPSQVEGDLPGFDSLHNPGDDLTLAIGELLEYEFPLRLAQALEHHLLGCLGGDPPGILGGGLHHEVFIKLSVLVYFFCLIQR